MIQFVNDCQRNMLEDKKLNYMIYEQNLSEGKNIQHIDINHKLETKHPAVEKTSYF